MSNFINLREIVQQFQTDPATRNDPVKRMFICDGEAITANIATSSGDDSKLHTQPNHDEIVIVIEGEAEFMVGDETRHVGRRCRLYLSMHHILTEQRAISSGTRASDDQKTQGPLMLSALERLPRRDGGGALPRPAGTGQASGEESQAVCLRCGKTSAIRCSPDVF
jgi:hypothetical protein